MARRKLVRYESPFASPVWVTPAKAEALRRADERALRGYSLAVIR